MNLSQRAEATLWREARGIRTGVQSFLAPPFVLNGMLTLIPQSEVLFAQGALTQPGKASSLRILMGKK